ncbi:MAG: CBS domain-containing protein [Hyphomicrobiales bacterium]|nr:CBS domain-containing protein [Hyphomicrobiales bacterium]
MLAKDLMTSKVVTVGPGYSIWHAAQRMLDHDVSGLPVVDDSGRVAGMLTQGDLLHRIELGAETAPVAPEQRLGAYVKAHSWNVGDVMTATVISVQEETPIHAVATLMDRHRIRRMPVVREGKLVGIISRKDLLRVIAASRRDTIPPGDDAMRRAILARLGENTDLQGGRLTVTVSGGVVHLGGTVGSDAERKAARVTAESVPGVEGVCDHMQVLDSASRSPASKLSDE